jgi:hypothetical protein
MTDYYKLLSDPSHAWLNDPDSPFRIPSGVRQSPCIYFKFRTFKLRSYGPKPQRLKYPVAEHPCLRWYKDREWCRRRVAYTEKLSSKEAFNYQMEYLIKHWHRQAESLNCDHEKPYVVMEDDSFTELFHL